MHILFGSMIKFQFLSQFAVAHYHYVYNIPMIRICEIDIGNLKTRNFTKLVQVRNFLLPLS